MNSNEAIATEQMYERGKLRVRVTCKSPDGRRRPKGMDCIVEIVNDQDQVVRNLTSDLDIVALKYEVDSRAEYAKLTLTLNRADVVLEDGTPMLLMGDDPSSTEFIGR